nr:hypothetical protein [Kangiella sp. TOML190]
MGIDYKVNEAVSAEQFQSLLKRSTLGERRPVEDISCLKGMLENSNLILSAWDQDELVGISRSVTDYHFAAIYPIWLLIESISVKVLESNYR